MAGLKDQHFPKSVLGKLGCNKTVANAQEFVNSRAQTLERYTALTAKAEQRSKNIAAAAATTDCVDSMEALALQLRRIDTCLAKLETDGKLYSGTPKFKSQTKRHNYQSKDVTKPKLKQSPQKKKSSGCSLKNINLARASSLPLTLLHKISACVVAH